MAFALVQTATVAGASTANSTAITLSATTQYNLVVVHVRLTGTSETVTSVTDSAGNTYVVQSAVDGSGGERMYQAYGVQLTGGTTTVTVNYSGSSLNKKAGADEYSGFGTGATNAAVFDASTTGTGTASPTAASTLTPAGIGELIVATLQHDNNTTVTAGSGYTLATAGAQQPNTICSQYKLSGGASETGPSTYDVPGVNYTERLTAFLAPPPAPVTGNAMFMGANF